MSRTPAPATAMWRGESPAASRRGEICGCPAGLHTVDLSPPPPTAIRYFQILYKKKKQKTTWNVDPLLDEKNTRTQQTKLNFNLIRCVGSVLRSSFVRAGGRVPSQQDILRTPQDNLSVSHSIKQEKERGPIIGRRAQGGNGVGVYRPRAGGSYPRKGRAKGRGGEVERSERSRGQAVTGLSLACSAFLLHLLLRPELT